MPKIIPRPAEQEFISFYKYHSRKDTATYFNVDEHMIKIWARQFNFKKIGTQLETIMTNKQLELVQGHMLGDASLRKIKGASNSYYAEEHSIAQEQWLKWTQSELFPLCRQMYYGTQSLPVNQNYKIINHDANKKSKFCKIITVSTKQFTELENKWYLRDENGNYVLDKNEWRIKIIPKDLILTPFMLFVWYLDDGCNEYNAKQITISSQSFSEKENLFLINQICDLGLSCYIKPYRNQFIIKFRTKAYFDFMDLIKSFNPVDCMRYKCDISAATYVTGPCCEPFSDDDKKEILHMRYYQKLLIREIAKQKNTSYGRIAYILKTDESYTHIKIYKKESTMTGIVKNGNGYQVYIGSCGKNIYLGYFNTFEEAKKVRLKAVELRNQGIADFTQI